MPVILSNTLYLFEHNTRSASILGIVGAGVQGRYNLLTLTSAVPSLKRVRVFDTDVQALTRFCEAMPEHVDLQIEPVSSSRNETPA